MPEVLRGLRRGKGESFACAPLYFVTASPPQLRRVLERKMLLDGVDYDGLTFKDWARTLIEVRPGRLREQIGFKICALLHARATRPNAVEYLFGDDVEDDAVSYFTYAALVEGALSGHDARRALTEYGVKDDDIACILDLLAELPSSHQGGVGGIFIHLERGRPASYFERFGGRVVAVRGAFQLALALYQRGLLDNRAVREARVALQSKVIFRKPNLDELLKDAVSRGLISADTAKEIVDAGAGSS